ncbi:archaetidylserine decarboxylase [Tahibacter amnicola]|uniref:Phosphatidylserine decarboxylase proenzyme n=1 Tax=Tahibacter amnicola TaxID=2976241 RepID=A0ABY6BBN9_9GAMM|nr:archaetidylserine decarboxylase [Tahibacter amnicola]UXI66967.1 archaetidylserine decarboxylase [Tahibacter amnicola]
MTFSLLLQYILPHQLLTRIVYWATRRQWRPWKNFLIGQIVRRFQVDLAEAQVTDIQQFEHFNAFFTRLLKPGARTAPADPAAIACPADGRISQMGPIEDGRIFQAKGQHYTAAELLASEADAAPYRDGSFITVYLSPRDYHRVHMPLAGRLVETVHVPGRLFSVAPAPVRAIPRLFARNERLVCHFEGEHGPFVVVMVGAMLVSSVSTVWSGLEIPPYARQVTRKSWRDKNIRLGRFDEMARFNMGSTAIVLLPKSGGRLEGSLLAEQAVRVGQSIGTTAP